MAVPVILLAALGIAWPKPSTAALKREIIIQRLGGNNPPLMNTYEQDKLRVATSDDELWERFWIELQESVRR